MAVFRDFNEVATSDCGLQFESNNWDRTRSFAVSAVRDFQHDGSRESTIQIKPFTFFDVQRAPPEWLRHPVVNILVIEKCFILVRTL